MRRFLQFFFFHFYHSLAWTYDFVAAIVSIGRWRDWGRVVVPHILGPNVLEIGFGPGHLQVEINQHGFRVFGLDESPQMVRQTRARLLNSALPYALARGIAQSLPFASGTMNSVVATFPTEYITDKHALAEFWRVLKPSGRLIVVPTAWIGGNSLPDRAARWLFRITGQAEEDLSETKHDRLMYSFSSAGFHVKIMHANVRQSKVLIVIAEKPSLE